MLQPIEF